jgi:indoleamine 2,3-dioxygenase
MSDNTNFVDMENITKNMETLINEFMVSVLGFLPEQCCNGIESNPNLNWINEIAQVMSENISGDSIGEYVDSIPDYDADIHSIEELTEGELQFAYSILTMLDNRYRWAKGVEHVKNVASSGDVIIPRNYGVVLYQICEKLGIAFALTHAGVDLWNWHLIDESQPFSLDNIDTNYTMTGNDSEKWFYKVMIAIEGVGGQALPYLFECINLIRQASSGEVDTDDVNTKIEWILELVNNYIETCVGIIKRMYENCDPNFFFNHLRIYLSGTINDNLPNNAKLDLEGNGEYITIAFKGGSAAQSTLIQVFDTFLGIKHEYEKKDDSDSPCGAFLKDMHKYMPSKHVQFLDLFDDDIYRAYIMSQPELVASYNKCVNSLARFRRAHLGLVRKYIMKFITNDTADSNNNAHGAKGSGGTNPYEFCGGLINDTDNAKLPESKCPFHNVGASSSSTSAVDTDTNVVTYKADLKFYIKIITLCTAVTIPVGWLIWRWS